MNESCIAMSDRRRLSVALCAALLCGCVSLAAAEESARKRGSSAAIVAPIFAHGDGKGAVGTVVKTPAVFLPEAEAVQTIAEELTRAGLSITKKDVEFRDVVVTQRREEYREVGREWKEEVVEIPGQIGVLSVDGLNEANSVAFEYVSEEDYFKLGGSKSATPFQFYDFKSVAEFIAGRMKRTATKVYFGVFYDPMAKPAPASRGAEADELSAEEQAAVREESKRLLRDQVRDFVEWLKKQGAVL